MIVLRFCEKVAAYARKCLGFIGATLILAISHLLISECAAAEVWNPSAVDSTRGEVMGVSNNQVIISNKSYQLTNNIVIMDERQQRRELKDIRVGDRVVFHLTNGMIDQLVLILPK